MKHTQRRKPTPDCWRTPWILYKSEIRTSPFFHNVCTCTVWLYVGLLLSFYSRHFQCVSLPIVQRSWRWWRWRQGTPYLQSGLGPNRTVGSLSLEASKNFDKNGGIEWKWDWRNCRDVFQHDQLFYQPVVSSPLRDNASVFTILSVCSFQLVVLLFLFFFFFFLKEKYD